MKMNKSIFRISKMDCPSEEQLIRLKLADFSNIKQLQFTLSERELIVFHDGDIGDAAKRIDELNLGSTLLSTEKTDHKEHASGDVKAEKKTLWIVLLINLSFFVIEMAFGWISSSMSLIADSLDMLADSFVYGLSLMAIGHAVSKKKRVAKLSGYLQVMLAIIGLAEVFRRFIGVDDMPIFQNMVLISSFALIANVVSYYLIRKTKSEEVHMKASAIFTSNDIIINLGVITAGVLVYLTQSRYPDLIVGLIIFGIVTRGAARIINLAR